MRFLRTLIRSLTLPNNAGPNDSRIVIGPDIPAELVTWGLAHTATFTAVEIFYVNGQRYKFNGIGTFSGVATYFEGTYDTTNTVYMVRRTLILGGAGFGTVRELVGSTSQNTFALDYQLLQTTMTVASDSKVLVGTGTVATASKNINIFGMTAGTTVSAVYVDIPGSPAVTITKTYGSGVTNLEVHIYGTFFSSGAVAGLEVGVAAGVTGDVNVTALRDANGSLASHTPFGGVAVLTGLAVGNHTITARWRRSSAAGTLATDARDVFSMSVNEVTA